MKKKKRNGNATAYVVKTNMDKHKFLINIEQIDLNFVVNKND